MFKSVFTVGFYTLISRIFGYIRDIFIASYIGSSVVADAFFVAFRIPNFFRRIFAEGAFSAAFIPILSGLVIKPKNKNEAMIFIEQSMSFLFFSLSIMSLLFYFTMPYIIAILAPGFINNSEVYELTVHFGKIVFPYLLFIALVSQFSAITNTFNRFAFGAFAPSLLNISFIASLLFFTPYVSTPGHALSYGVLVGGILQFIIMYYAIYRIKITPFLVLPKINNNIRKFFRLFFPGILGAGAIQLNILVGTIIASFLPTGAISHLYYADRISQLPLAVIGIALGIVLLPTLSNYIKKEEDVKKVYNIQNRSIEFSLMISLPAMIGLFLLAEPIIKILFERGSFTSIDTYYSSKALALFAIGLPGYILIKVLNPNFFAREDTKTPFYITLVCVFINIIFSLIFIKYFREAGIALATALAAWINAIILYFILKNRGHINLDTKLKNNIIKIIFATVIIFIFILITRNVFVIKSLDNIFIIQVIILLLNIMFAIIIFASLIFMLKIYKIDEIREYLKKN